MKKTSINTFVMSEGERYCLILDKETGVPLYYPTLYITTQVRNSSDSISTVELVAGAISLFCNFLSERGINIEERIRSGKNLSIYEIDALRDYCEKKNRIRQYLPHNVRKASTVNSTTKHYRLTNIANYISWLGPTLTQEEASITALVERIRERRPKLGKRNRQDQPDRSLDENQISLLFEVIKCGSKLNPFGKKLQMRNRLIVLVLYSLGIRSGELLNIRISDINFSNSSLAIRRRADDKDDPRVKQPLVKTRERKLPLSAALANELHDYITTERRKFKKARKHEYLFVTNKSGPTQGLPLSIMAYHKIIDSVRSVVPELRNITGHKFRHTWNYEFSKKLDEMPEKMSEAEQEKIRSRLMGWRQGSGTAQIYNKRFIEDKSQKVALKLQEGIFKKGDENENNQ